MLIDLRFNIFIVEVEKPSHIPFFSLEYGSLEASSFILIYNDYSFFIVFYPSELTFPFTNGKIWWWPRLLALIHSKTALHFIRWLMDLPCDLVLFFLTLTWTFSSLFVLWLRLSTVTLCSTFCFRSFFLCKFKWIMNFLRILFFWMWLCQGPCLLACT